MTGHAVVSHDEWIAARRDLLRKEKNFTKAYEALNEERRNLPWVRVDKQYVFDTPTGKQTLADLFQGRSQLIIYHFMFGPGWKEGCVGCSFLSDSVNGAHVHLENHDVSFVVVSRAPLTEIEPFKKRMGWDFRWVSSHGSDFNFDFNVSFTPEQKAAGRGFYNFAEQAVPSEELSGTSVFYKDESGQIYRTYSAYARGGELHIGTYVLLDMTPKGRNETGPRHDLSDWVRHHDRYGAGGHVAPSGRYVPAQETGGSCCHQAEEATA